MCAGGAACVGGEDVGAAGAVEVGTVVDRAVDEAVMGEAVEDALVEVAGARVGSMSVVTPPHAVTSNATVPIAPTTVT